MRPIAVAALALVLVGCGSKPKPTLAGCLDDHGFLASGTAGRARGTSPEGVAFSLTLHADRAAARRALARLPRATAALAGLAVVDWHGNPSPRARLTAAELATIRSCTTLAAPAAR